MGPDVRLSTMSIAQLYGKGRPVFSFEFFPPKTDAGYDALYRTITDLSQLNPDYVSVTWGAGGSTRRKTVEIVARIQREIGITAMAHLSCIGSTPEQIEQTIAALIDAHVKNVLVLGGDRPEGYEPPEGAFVYANELAAFIRSKHFDVCLGGACYPEKHPLAPSPEVDMENLVRKVDAGVEFLITQLFFDNRDFFDFCDRARAAGITVPIVAGIMPILSAQSIRRMTSLSGAKLPSELEAKLSQTEHDDASTREVGVEWATRQCRELLEQGVPGIHFYTLNKSPATRNIFENLLAK